MRTLATLQGVDAGTIHLDDLDVLRRAGIDPYHKLIDRDAGDNVRAASPAEP